VHAERNPPIDEVIKQNVIPQFVAFLKRADMPQLQVRDQSRVFAVDVPSRFTSPEAPDVAVAEQSYQCWQKGTEQAAVWPIIITQLHQPVHVCVLKALTFLCYVLVAV
jgi:hypothetical protein